MTKRREEDQPPAEELRFLEDLRKIFCHFLEGGHLFLEKERLTHGINHALLAMFSQATNHPLGVQDFTIGISHPASWAPLINHPKILRFSLENLNAKAVRAVGKQIEAGSPYQLH